MINLLPLESKQQFRAARLNVILVRYIIILGLAIVFLAAVIGGAYSILTTVKTGAEATITQNQAKAAQYGSTEAQAAALQSNLASAKAILNSDVDYTKLVTGIAALVPSGVILDKLSLNPNVFGVPTNIQAYAKTTDEAIALKNAFQSSPIFSNVSFQTLSNKSGTSDYPINALLSVTINKVVTQ